MNTKNLAAYAKNLFTYFGASLIPMLLNLISNPWIAKNMDPEDYAVTGYYTSFNSLIQPIIVFYLIHYYIKEYFNRSPHDRERLFAIIARALIWFSGIVTLVCFFILLVYLKYITATLSFPIFPYMALALAALPLTGLFNLQLARYRMEKNSKSFFRLSVSNGVFATFLTVSMVVFLKWGAFGKLLAPLACNLTVFTFLVFKFKDTWRIKTSMAEFKPIFWFCLPLAASAMLGYFTSGFTTTYLESVGNVREYGIYVVGVQIGMYLNIFATAISNTFQPDRYEAIATGNRRNLIKYCALQLGLTGFVVILFAIAAPLVISILTAGRYVDSTVYAQIIAISTLTSSIYYILNDYTIAKGYPRLYLVTTIIGSVAVILLMPWAVSRWQYIGGTWITVASYLILTLVNIALLGLVKVRKR